MILAFFYNINVYCHHPPPALVKSGQGENKKLFWGLTFKWAKLFEVGEKYIALYLHYCCCLIVATFQVEWSFSSFQQEITFFFLW